MNTRNRKHTLNLTRHSSNQLVCDSLKLVNGILVAALIATRTVNHIANRLPSANPKDDESCSVAV